MPFYFAPLHLHSLPKTLYITSDVEAPDPSYPHRMELLVFHCQADRKTNGQHYLLLLHP